MPTTANGFVILGTQRTGTTLIRTCLSSHPDVHCVGEAFELGRRPYKQEDGYWYFRRQSPAHRIAALFRPRQSVAQYLHELYSDTSHAAVGFKLMYSHLQARPYLWSQLESLDLRVLHVTRRNVLKTLISRRSAASSGVYHVSGNHRANKIQLDTSNLLRDLQIIAAEEKQWRSMLRPDTPYLGLVYEDYLVDQAQSNTQICEFLGIPARSMHSELKKVNPDSLREILGNYEEVQAALQGSEFAKYLDGTRDTATQV